MLFQAISNLYKFHAADVLSTHHKLLAEVHKSSQI